MSRVDSRGGPGPSVATSIPGDWGDLLSHVAAVPFTAQAGWTRLAAHHYPGATSRWLQVRQGDDLLGGMAVLARPRRGLVRLESSFDGTEGGPQIRSDLSSQQRGSVVRALGRALAGQLKGRAGLAAMTLAGEHAEADAGILAEEGWLRQDYEAAVVPCTGGLDHVGRELWTNNRRNERNRGLKRGCSLHGGADADALARWYPLYEAKARQWAQAPVPLGFLQDLLTEFPDQMCFGHVRLEGEVIAGHLGFISGDRLVAWQGAARPDLARTHFLTTLLYWRDLMTACERGLQAVDFGGCVGRDSLWDFKRRCGAEPSRRIQLVRRSWVGRAHGLLAMVLRHGRGDGS